MILSKNNQVREWFGAMDRKIVMFPLKYFASGAQALHKPAIPLDSAPTKQVLPQGRFKTANNPQATMNGKTDIMVNQEVRESYDNEAAEGATEILQGDENFFGADAKFEEARAEESATRARSQRAGNLAGHAIGTDTERKDNEEEENAARNRM